ncbi:MAG: hypothetical protein AAGB51_14425 [Planctomycetota bacterium]
MSESDSQRGDVGRIATGAVFVALAIGVVGVGFATKQSVDGRGHERAESTVRMAAERGVDLAGGTPQQVAERLRSSIDTARDPASLTEVSGVLMDAGNVPFNGLLATRFADGSPETMWTVVDGRPEGHAVQFYEDGSIKRKWAYFDNEVMGQFLDFYPTGDLKLRAVFADPSPNGGTEAGQLSFGLLDTEGKYTQRNLGSGRVQFIYEDGSTDRRNETIAPNDVQGFMLFKFGMFGQQSPVTTDSRQLDPAV